MEDIRYSKAEEDAAYQHQLEIPFGMNEPQIRRDYVRLCMTFDEMEVLHEFIGAVLRDERRWRHDNT